MKLRLLSLVAVAILLAACAKKPTETAATAVSAPPPAAAAPAPPRGPAPDSLEYFNTVVGNMVNFAYDKYDLDAASQTKLKGQAAWLKQYPSRTLTVEGHCDERGTREYNLALGQRRAQTVKSALEIYGVKDAQVEAISYGAEKPKASARRVVSAAFKARSPPA